MEFSFNDDGDVCINTIVELGGFNSANEAMRWIITAARGLLVRERDGWVAVFNSENNEQEGVIFSRDDAIGKKARDILNKLGVKEVP